MVAAGEGASSYEGGGAGGKFRKRPFRRPQTTPYDRPPTALRNPNRNGWLSKLIDPASKLISASAHMFFSSVLRKPLPALPQPPQEANQELRDSLQDAVPNNCTGVREPAIDQGENLTNSCDGSGISELEQMLKHKTFSRSEIDRLTELLHSRTVENLSKPLSDIERHEGFISSPLQENKNERDKFHGIISAPVVSSRVLEEDVASPAELAKAYMGSRPSEVSPSMLGLRSQALREDATLLNNVSFPPKSPIVSLASKTVVRVGVPENGFMTPRSRGRSAIYSMARTPYSRVHLTATQKGTGSTNYGYGGPSSSSSSHSAWEHDRQFGSKQVALKRRNSVLDDDFGSVGAIRRIRQKLNISSQGSLGTGVGSHAAQHCISSRQKLVLLDEPNHSVSKTVEANENNSFPSTSYAFVPSKSSEMATKILQSLEKLSPKDKSSESKILSARERATTKLTPNMLHGQALRNLEDVDSPKFLQNAQNSRNLVDLRNAWLPDTRDSPSQKQDKVEENSPKKFVVPHDMSTSSMNSDTIVSKKDIVPNVKTADSIISKFAAQPPQKTRAFQMSAHEGCFMKDFLELDDDIHSNGLASTPSAEGREKLGTFVVEREEDVSTKTLTLDKTPTLPETKTPAGSLLNRTDFEIYGGSFVGQEKTGFTFPTSPAPSITYQPADLIQCTSAFDKVVPPKDPKASANEFPDLKSGSKSDPKPESSNSLANVSSGTTDAQLKVLESDKDGNKNAQKAGDIMGDSETLLSAASASTSRSIIFSPGAPAKNIYTSNGSLGSSHSIFSSTAPGMASSNFSSTHVPSSTSTSAVKSTGTTTTTTAFNRGPSMVVAAPSLPAAPIFNFGSSLAPSTSVSTVLTTFGADTTDIGAKPENETTFGNLMRSPFGGTSFAMASTGSGVFGFSSSVTSPITYNHSQSSPFGTVSGSLASAQASSGTGFAITQNMPIQFGSSGSSPVFGTSGIMTFTSSSSLPGSSNSAAKLFGSGTSFGIGSSASSSENNSVSSTSGVTSSTGFSWPPSKSPIFSSAFSSSSPSAGFSFGASSTSVAATNSAPMVFGSSTGASLGSMFSFISGSAATSSLPSISQPLSNFGDSNPVFAAPSSNNDQMNMEDSMAEDPVQATTPAAPIFGQIPVLLPSAGFMFNSTAPSPSQPLLFVGQQNQYAPQNNLASSQASSSLDFSAGGSFSLGSGGGDKSSRRIVRVKRRMGKK